MTITESILKEFDEKFIDCVFGDYSEGWDLKDRLTELKPFLLQSIRKVVESCPETMTFEYGPDDTVTSDAIAWKSSILKELK